jgi:hypothetical protein
MDRLGMNLFALVDEVILLSQFVVQKHEAFIVDSEIERLPVLYETQLMLSDDHLIAQ